MKKTLFALALFGISTLTQAQVNFKKSALIEHSFYMTPPDIIKVGDKYAIIQIKDKKILQQNFDSDLNLEDMQKIDIDKDLNVSRIEVIDGKTYLFAIDNPSKTLNIYTYDPVAMSIGEKVISSKFECTQDDHFLITNINSSEENIIVEISFQKSTSNGAGGGFVYNFLNQLIILSRKMDKVVNTYSIPYAEESVESKKRSLSPYYGYILPNNDLVETMTEGIFYLAKPLEEAQTKLYHFTGQDYQEVYSKNAFYSGNILKDSSMVFPFYLSNGEIMTWQFSYFDGLKLYVNNNGNINELKLSEMYVSPNRKKIIANPIRFNFDENYQNGEACFLFQQDLDKGEKDISGERNFINHELVFITFKDGQLESSEVYNIGNIASFYHQVRKLSVGVIEANNYLIFENSLDYFDGKSIHFTEEKEVFDKYIRTAGTEPGFTYNYYVDGVIFSLHTEYAMGNMKSQLVKWEFK